jgi:hypothetical protein
MEIWAGIAATGETNPAQIDQARYRRTSMPVTGRVV